MKTPNDPLTVGQEMTATEVRARIAEYHAADMARPPDPQVVALVDRMREVAAAHMKAISSINYRTSRTP